LFFAVGTTHFPLLILHLEAAVAAAFPLFSPISPVAPAPDDRAEKRQKGNFYYRTVFIFAVVCTGLPAMSFGPLLNFGIALKLLCSHRSISRHFLRGQQFSEKGHF